MIRANRQDAVTTRIWIRHENPHTSITDSTRNLLLKYSALLYYTTRHTFEYTQLLNGHIAVASEKKEKENASHRLSTPTNAIFPARLPASSNIRTYVFNIITQESSQENPSMALEWICKYFYAILSRYVLLFHVNGTHRRVLLVWRLLPSENLR